MGESLVRLGYIREEDLHAFLARQFELPQIDLIKQRIPQAVLEYIPESKAREFCVIPVEQIEIRGVMHLLVAMPDPTNLSVIDTLQFMTECWIKPTMASPESILKAINVQYGATAQQRLGVNQPPSRPPFPHQPEYKPTYAEALPTEMAIKHLEERFAQLIRLLIRQNSPLLKELDELLSSLLQHGLPSGK